MTLTPEQREQVRLSLLRYGLGGVSLRLAVQNLRNEGFRNISEEVVRLEVEYLLDKGLLASVPKEVSPENILLRTTAKGRDFLAVQGIEP